MNLAEMCGHIATREELQKLLVEQTAETDKLRGRLRDIGDYAHAHSAGPAVPDGMWEIRTMAYEYA